MASRAGPIRPSMRESGMIIKPMARDSSGVQTETPMKVLGKTTKQTASVISNQWMAKRAISVTGKTTCTTDRVSKVGQMAPDSTVTSKKGRSTVLGLTSGLMALSTRAVG